MYGLPNEKVKKARANNRTHDCPSILASDPKSEHQQDANEEQKEKVFHCRNSSQFSISAYPNWIAA